MSNQSEAKARQQYTPKLIPNVCGTCAHRKADRVLPAWMRGRPGYTLGKDGRDANVRCGIGGFAIKAMGSCAEWCGTELATGATHA